MSRIEQVGFVTLGGKEQWVSLRGEDARNPILLMLSGPGLAFSALGELFAPLERRFTLAQWDQPGAGRTADRHGQDDLLSLERLIADGLALAEHLRRRLPEAPLVPLGVSGGSIIGLSLVASRPDLFAAYAGQGQIFDWPRQQAMSYAMTLQQSGDADLAALGPPPWPDVAADAVWSRHAGAPTAAELAALMALPRPPAGEDPRARATAAFARLREDIAAFRAPSRFERPLVFLQGAADLYTPTTALEDWLAGVEAPSKAVVAIPDAGHGAIFLVEGIAAALDPLFLGGALAGM